MIFRYCSPSGKKLTLSDFLLQYSFVQEREACMKSGFFRGFQQRQKIVAPQFSLGNCLNRLITLSLILDSIWVVLPLLSEKEPLIISV